MQKQINFFEKNVEWIALGVGGLFLLFMVYLYVLNAPVAATGVGGKDLGPGEVDPATLAGPIEDLKRDISNPTIPEIRQKDYVESFVATIQGSDQDLVQLAGTQIHSTPWREVGPGGLVIGPDGVATKPVTELPKPPAAEFEALLHGRSRVTWQDPTWEPKPNRPTEVPKMIEADKDWWSGSWTIDSEALATAFEKAFDEQKIDEARLDPQQFMQTAIVNVELVRREILPGNRVGKEVVVGQLQNSLKPPFPTEKSKEYEVSEYITWATTTPQDVVEPAFYEVMAGDIYDTPSLEAEEAAKALREVNKEQRQQMLEQKRNEQRQRAQAGAQARLRGRGGLLPEDEMEMDLMEGDVVPRGRGGRPVMPIRPVPGARQRALPPGAAAAAAIPAGPGKFRVVHGVENIRIVAHDDTVQPGKTYQYKLRYHILNPVYKGTAAPPELTKDFAIPAVSWSGWSRPTKIRDKVEFFIAKLSGERADFEVFEWREGQTKKRTVSVSAGDAIGTTGWSFVEARGTGSKGYGLIVDDSTGHVVRRVPEIDRASDRYEDLSFEVEVSASAVGVNR